MKSSWEAFENDSNRLTEITLITNLAQSWPLYKSYNICYIIYILHINNIYTHKAYHIHMFLFFFPFSVLGRVKSGGQGQGPGCVLSILTFKI